MSVLEAGAQLLTVAVGLIEFGPQRLEIVFIATVGGFLIVTICGGEITVPHEFVEVSVMLYVPGSVKLYEAFVVVWFGIAITLVPQ